MFLTDDSIFVGELNGNEIQNMQDYLRIVSDVFDFPKSPRKSVDGYLDWIRDLDWLNKDGYILIIHNFTNCMKDDIAAKNEIIELFEAWIFPWWKEEVIYCMGNGSLKPFNVYFVD